MTDSCPQWFISPAAAQRPSWSYMYLYLIRVSLAHESVPKQHLDRFSHFCRAHDYVKHTDRQTDHTMHDICSSSLHVALLASGVG